MATWSNQGGTATIIAVTGVDLSVPFTITENSVARAWSSDTTTASIYDRDGTAATVATFTFTQGASGAATMSLTSAQLTTLGVGTFRYAVINSTSGGVETAWVVGQFSILNPWEGGTATTGVTVAITTGGGITIDIAVTATAATQITVADAGGYFAATNVETMGQELGARINGLQRLPTSVIAQSIPRTQVRDNLTASFVSGQQSFVLVWLPAGLISTISFSSATTAAITPTAQWFSVYSSARALLAVTADDTTTAWAANTIKTLTISGGYTVPTEGYYYLGAMVAAATVPTLLGYVSSTVSNVLPLIVSGRDTTNTGLTTPGTAPSTAAAFSVLAGDPYAYVS